MSFFLGIVVAYFYIFCGIYLQNFVESLRNYFAKVGLDSKNLKLIEFAKKNCKDCRKSSFESKSRDPKWSNDPQKYFYEMAIFFSKT